MREPRPGRVPPLRAASEKLRGASPLPARAEAESVRFFASSGSRSDALRFPRPLRSEARLGLRPEALDGYGYLRAASSRPSRSGEAKSPAHASRLVHNNVFM